MANTLTISKESIEFIVWTVVTASSSFIGSRFLPKIASRQDERTVLSICGGVGGFVFGAALCQSPLSAISAAAVVGAVSYNAYHTYTA